MLVLTLVVCRYLDFCSFVVPLILVALLVSQNPVQQPAFGSILNILLNIPLNTIFHFEQNCSLFVDRFSSV